ncbi:MAG: 50S ribosomal protein P1, partial [Actinomycetota bacterium]|nr:50S ribosomal protein P1 [Actinomycetota bacterium]
RARLALQQTEDGKWRVEFDEPWAGTAGGAGGQGAGTAGGAGGPPESDDTLEAAEAIPAEQPAAA